MICKLKLVASVLGAVFCPAMVLACSFHLYLPEKTIVDRILTSPHIVLARPSKTNPFRYVAVGAYRGSVHDVEIPDLVDTRSRRRLLAAPSHMVMFARDEASGPWKRVAYLDDTFRFAIDNVFNQLDIWAIGGDRLRFSHASRFLNHPHSALADLAFAELDRAPYAVLRDLELEIDAAPLLNDFFASDRYSTTPIRALLLGLSGAPEARQFLRAQFSSGVRPAGVTAGAMAVGLIEIDQSHGVDTVAGALGLREGVDFATQEILIEAMAIQAKAGDSELRAKINATIKDLLEQEPMLAASVARQFSRRSIWTHQDAVLAAAAHLQMLSSEDRFDIANYVSSARKREL